MNKGTKIRDGYRSRQISCFKRRDRLIETISKLTPVKTEYAENLFANEKYMDGKEVKKDYSVISISILKYGNGNTENVSFNLEPYIFKSLQRECSPPINYGRDYEKNYLKSYPLENGDLKISTILIRYQDKDTSGKKRRYPWYIQIQEDIGKSDKTKRKIIENRKSKKHYINMTNDEYQEMIDSSCLYIDSFAFAFAVPAIRAKQKELSYRHEAWKAGGYNVS